MADQNLEGAVKSSLDMDLSCFVSPPSPFNYLESSSSGAMGSFRFGHVYHSIPRIALTLPDSILIPRVGSEMAEKHLTKESLLGGSGFLTT